MYGNPFVVALAETPSNPTLTADNITEATGHIFTVVGQTLTEIVSQPIFLMFLVAGLVFMAIRIIRALKQS